MAPAPVWRYTLAMIRMRALSLLLLIMSGAAAGAHAHTVGPGHPARAWRVQDQNGPPAQGKADQRESSPMTFVCETGELLTMRLGSRGDDMIATIMVDSQQHVLPLQPWDGANAQIVWSNSDSTLTWSTGVRLMWMSGSTHLMCGRAGGHKH